jgi:predicted enzyme related to lactoylglutathione lyase
VPNFVIPAVDLDRAVAFYGRVFQCHVSSFVDGTREFTPRPIAGRDNPTVAIHARAEQVRDHDCINVFCVGAFDATITRVHLSGGSVVIDTVDANGIRIAVCRDTEGNRFCIEHADDPRAAPMG